MTTSKNLSISTNLNNRYTTENIIDLFDRGIGWNKYFNKYAHPSYSSTYPPTDITQIDENETIIEMAVAGYKEEDLKVEYFKNTLTVTGSKVSPNAVHSKIVGEIARRSFVRSFAIADDCEIKEVSLSDGILSISVVQNIPEEKKPKILTITRK
jgi:molecular chaperone IbpA